MVGNPGTRERATEARGHVHNKRRSLAGTLLTTSGARPKAALACGYIKSGGSAAIGAHGSAALAFDPSPVDCTPPPGLILRGGVLLPVRPHGVNKRPGLRPGTLGFQ